MKPSFPAKEEHGNNKKVKEIFAFIRKNNNFLLSTHINADGDAIASVLAVSLILDNLNKRYFMVLHDQKIDTRFNYLKNFDQLISYKKKLNFTIQAAIILDAPGIKRLGDVANLLPPSSKVAKIDHHPSEDNFAEVNMLDDKASSTAKLIFDLVQASKIKLDLDMAKAIYTGIIYDTGRLSFTNTTAEDLYICARMVDLGVEPAAINNKIFFENSFQALQTIGKGLASMESYFNGMVIVIYLDYKSINRNDQGEIEELANYSVAIRGGKVGLFIREFKPGFHKISLRSKDDINVHKIAQSFNGGGHVHASGCRMKGGKEEVIKRLLAEVEKYL